MCLHFTKLFRLCSFCLRGKLSAPFVVTACVWNYLKAYFSPVVKLIIEIRYLNSLKMFFFFFFAENWQKTFHNAELKLFFFFFFPLCLHFPLAFHSISAGVQAQIEGPSSSLYSSCLKFCFTALSWVISKFPGHVLCPHAGVLPVPKDGFWLFFHSWSCCTVQTDCATLLYLRYVKTALHKLPSEQV